MIRIRQLRQHRVEVMGNSVDAPACYIVYAYDPMDARIIAFIMAGGLCQAQLKITPGDIELVKVCTRIV